MTRLVAAIGILVAPLALVGCAGNAARSQVYTPPASGTVVVEPTTTD